MSKYEIPFINTCISEFGKKFGLTLREAYSYLKEHGGMDFMVEFYDVEHLQSMEETVDDLAKICMNNGGKIENDTIPRNKQGY